MKCADVAPSHAICTWFTGGGVQKTVSPYVAYGHRSGPPGPPSAPPNRKSLFSIWLNHIRTPRLLDRLTHGARPLAFRGNDQLGSQGSVLGKGRVPTSRERRLRCSIPAVLAPSLVALTTQTISPGVERVNSLPNLGATTSTQKWIRL